MKPEGNAVKGSETRRKGSDKQWNYKGGHLTAVKLQGMAVTGCESTREGSETLTFCFVITPSFSAMAWQGTGATGVHRGGAWGELVRIGKRSWQLGGPGSLRLATSAARESVPLRDLPL